VITLCKVRSLKTTLSNTRFLQITKFNQYLVSPELLSLLTLSGVCVITLCKVRSLKTTLSNTRFASILRARPLKSVITRYPDSTHLYPESLPESDSDSLAIVRVYRQSVCLGAEPLDTHGQNFFFLNRPPAIIVLI
jgi:hypothetical protein